MATIIDIEIPKIIGKLFLFSFEFYWGNPEDEIVTDKIWDPPTPLLNRLDLILFSASTEELIELASIDWSTVSDPIWYPKIFNDLEQDSSSFYLIFAGNALQISFLILPLLVTTFSILVWLESDSLYSPLGL